MSIEEEEDFRGDDLVLAYLDQIGESIRVSASARSTAPQPDAHRLGASASSSMTIAKRDRRRSALSPTSSSESLSNVGAPLSLSTSLGQGMMKDLGKTTPVGRHDAGLQEPIRKRRKSEDRKIEHSHSLRQGGDDRSKLVARKTIPPARETESALSLLRRERLKATASSMGTTPAMRSRPEGAIAAPFADISFTQPAPATPEIPQSERTVRLRSSQIIDISDSPPAAKQLHTASGPSLPPGFRPKTSSKPYLAEPCTTSSITTSNHLELSSEEKPIWPPTKVYVDEAMAAYNKRTKDVLDRRKKADKQKVTVKNEDGTDGRTRAEITKHLLSTLKDEANPITHSDIYSRTQHVISAASGHQVSQSAGGTKFGISSGDYFKSRNMKLKQQFRAQISDGMRAAVSANGSTAASGTGDGEDSAIDMEGEKAAPYPMESKTGTQLGLVTDKPGLVGIGIGGRFSVEMAKKRSESGSSSGSGAEVSGFVQTSSIFAGLTFYLNGYSGPRISDLELKRLLAIHGGNISYVASSACTHILVVNNLSASKAQKFLDASGSTRGKKCKVVHVDWVLDSVELGKRLSEVKYNVINNRTQPTLMSTWAAGSKPSSGKVKQADHPMDDGEASD